MSILPILANLAGFLFFLFFFWKRLREDYSSLAIFSVVFYITLTGAVLGVAARYGLTRLIPSTTVFTSSGLWFWTAVIGGMIGLIVSIYKFKLRFFETFEAAVLGLFYWLAFIFLGDGLANSSLVSLIGAGLVCVLIFVFYFVSKNYRKLTWYKSGRIGIAGLVGAILFFGLRVAVALTFPYVLSFVGKFDALLSGTVVVLLLYGVYELSGDY